MPWVGATLCTFPALSLVSTNAMVDNPHGGPHLLPFVALYPGAYDEGSGISPMRSLDPGGWMPWESFALRFLTFWTAVHRPPILPLSRFDSPPALTLPVVIPAERFPLELLNFFSRALDARNDFYPARHF